MNNRCNICNGPDRQGHAPGPQDPIAAAICFLHASVDGPRSVLQRLEDRRRHPAKRCRYCSMTQKQKLEIVNSGWDHEPTDPRWAAWKNLSNAQQFARVNEAQEVTWLDQIPAEA